MKIISGVCSEFKCILCDDRGEALEQHNECTARASELTREIYVNVIRVCSWLSAG